MFIIIVGYCLTMAKQIHGGRMNVLRKGKDLENGFFDETLRQTDKKFKEQIGVWIRWKQGEGYKLTERHSVWY